jgi:hypothetical protein
VRVSKRLRQAIQTYYYNRSRAGTHTWNKLADLEAISAAAAAGGYRFSAAAGTFWFTKATKRHVVTYTTFESIFPEFQREVKPVSKWNAGGC